MKAGRTVLLGGTIFVIMCGGSGPVVAQNPDVPNGFREGPSLQNGFSGDRRIRLATFHTLLVVDTNHPRHRVCGPITLSEIGTLFNTVNRDLFTTKPGEAARPIDPRLQLIAGADRSRQTVLKGDQVTKRNIERAVDNIGDRIRLLTADGSDDTSAHVVLAWIEAEGELDPQTGDRVLKLKNGDTIDRKQLCKRLEFWDGGQRLTRLLVFVTDACSVPVAGDLDRLRAGRTEHSPVIWRSLYFGHEGTVDLSSSQPGKASFAINGVSLFARAFRAGFDTLEKIEIDLPVAGARDGFIEWHSEFLEAVQRELDKAVDDKTNKLQLDDSASTVKRLIAP